MSAEKASDVEDSSANHVPTYSHKDAATVVASKGHGIGEAADIYGDIETAEEMGYVNRGYVLIVPAHLRSFQCTSLVSSYFTCIFNSVLYKAIGSYRCAILSN
jgi:hypothetical protein